MVVMWKLDRKRCLREMVSVSRCHRDLFLFLWGFTLVTKLLSGSSPTPPPRPKALKAFGICDGDCSVDTAFLLFRFGFGFKV